MELTAFSVLAARAVAMLAVVLAIAWLGRTAARRLRQPAVIGEIVAGLLAGALVVRLTGPAGFPRLVSPGMLAVLKTTSEAGLVLFLVGLAHELRIGPARPGRKAAVTWVAAGSLVPSLVVGALLGCWLLLSPGTAARGTAPGPALVLFVAVSLSITAVPVLARILADRGLTRTEPGRIALVSAVLIDTGGWLLVAIALGLASGSPAGFLRSVAVLAGGALVALALRQVLRSAPGRRLGARLPRATAVALGVLALAVAMSVERLGLTAVFGAVLVGLAVPAGEDSRWAAPVRAVTAVGRALVPAFFVVTGITVLATAFEEVPWGLMAVTTALGILGKVGGGYAGARLGAFPVHQAARIGVLMNTRGLTELIVLQIGYSARILTAPLFVAFLTMALVTTGLTGPLLSLLDHAEARNAGQHRKAESAIQEKEHR
jgi:Kef-type K+ transport system membrane component KefB